MIVLDLSPQPPLEWLRFKIIHAFNVLSSLVDRRLARIKWRTRRFKASKVHSRIRRRALTLPLPPNSSCEVRTPNLWPRFLPAFQITGTRTKSEKKIIQKTMDQYHSPIFKLPFEIREMIWKYVLGIGTIHITHLQNRLGHASCTYPTDKEWDWSTHDCWGRGCCLSATRKAPSVYVGPIYGFEEPKDLLGLSKTCRAIYSETIGLLYKSNTFDFRYPHTIAAFCSTVPQHRLNLITSLQLTCDILNLSDLSITLAFETPHLSSEILEDRVILGGVLGVIGGLKGLRVLRIENQDRHRYYRNYPYASSANIKDQIFQALCSITQTETFEVKAPWLLEDIQTELVDLPIPFKLRVPRNGR